MRTSLLLCLFLLLPFPHPGDAAPARWRTAYVADARLAALREKPGLQAPLLKRLRTGRRVSILTRSRDREGFAWVRVAVTRRTRGWLLEDAIAEPGHAASEQRLAALVDATSGIARIQVARLAYDRFRPLRAMAARALEEETARAAGELTRRLARRSGAFESSSEAEIRALMLSDPALDRYRRLGIVFDVDVPARRYRPRPYER